MKNHLIIVEVGRYAPVYRLVEPKLSKADQCEFCGRTLEAFEQANKVSVEQDTVELTDLIIHRYRFRSKCFDKGLSLAAVIADTLLEIVKHERN